MHNQVEMFDDLGLWKRQPLAGFEGWIARQGYDDSSSVVMRSMFGKFLRYLAANGSELFRCKAVDIVAFLAQSEEEERERRKADGGAGGRKTQHRYRYVRLLERVYDHLKDIGLQGDNPAQQAAFAGAARGSNNPTKFLSADERGAVVGAIEAVMGNGDAGWMAMRDAALCAAMLGGGLKVGRAGALTVNCIDLTENWLRLPSLGNDQAHKSRLYPFASSALAVWLAVRHDLTLVADNREIVFPADRARRGLGRAGVGPIMSAASLFRRVQRFLAGCGIQGTRACPQLLRNSYAGMLFDDEAPDEEIMESLGFFEGASLPRLRMAYARHKNARLALPQAALARPEGIG